MEAMKATSHGRRKILVEKLVIKFNLTNETVEYLKAPHWNFQKFPQLCDLVGMVLHTKFYQTTYVYLTTERDSLNSVLLREKSQYYNSFSCIFGKIPY